MDIQELTKGLRFARICVNESAADRPSGAKTEELIAKSKEEAKEA